MATRTVVVEFLALHVGCAACCATARLDADCNVYADWAQHHSLPELRRAEVLVNGEFCVRPIRARGESS